VRRKLDDQFTVLLLRRNSAHILGQTLIYLSDINETFLFVI